MFVSAVLHPFCYIKCSIIRTRIMVIIIKTILTRHKITHWQFIWSLLFLVFLSSLAWRSARKMMSDLTLFNLLSNDVEVLSVCTVWSIDTACRGSRGAARSIRSWSTSTGLEGGLDRSFPESGRNKSVIELTNTNTKELKNGYKS